MCVCRNVCGFYIKSRCLLCTRVCCCARAASGAGHLPGARGPRRPLQGEEPCPARTAVLGKPARGRLLLAGQGWTIGWCRRVAMVISSVKSLCAWPSVGLGHTGSHGEVPASPCSDAAQGWCQRVPVTPLSGCRAAMAASSGSTRLFWGRAWRRVLRQAVWWEQSGVTPVVRAAAERWGDGVLAPRETEEGRGDLEEEKWVPGSGAASSRRGAVAAPFPRTTVLCCTWDPAASPGDRQVLIPLPQSCRQAPAALPAGPKSAMANDRDLRCGAAHDPSCLGSAGSESTGLGEAVSSTPSWRVGTGHPPGTGTASLPAGPTHRTSCPACSGTSKKPPEALAGAVPADMAPGAAGAQAAASRYHQHRGAPSWKGQHRRERGAGT